MTGEDAVLAGLGGSRQTVSDAEAVADVARKLQEVVDEIADVKRLGGVAAREQLEAEREHLVRYLADAMTPAGRLRQFPGSAAGRARVAVRNALTRAYHHLESAGPEFAALAQHLRAAIVVSGTSYTYRPPTLAPNWELSGVAA